MPRSSPSSTFETGILPAAVLSTADDILRIMFHRKWSARKVSTSSSPSRRAEASFISMTVPLPSALQKPEKSWTPWKSDAHSSASPMSRPSARATYSYVRMSACRGRNESFTRAYAVQRTPP